MAERRRASAARSRTNATPPSPSTNPSRPRSNGRDAPTGSEFRRDSARRLPNVASPIGVTARSQAPATQTSTKPEPQPVTADLQSVIAAGTRRGQCQCRPRELQIATGPLDRRFPCPGRGRMTPCPAAEVIGLPRGTSARHPVPAPDRTGPRGEPPRARRREAPSRRTNGRAGPVRLFAAKAVGSTARGNRDPPDLGGDPARIVLRRKSGHRSLRPNARPAGSTRSRASSQPSGVAAPMPVIQIGSSLSIAHHSRPSGPSTSST